MIGIYKITNILNDKCYIGQSIDIESRWEQHIYAGTHNIERLKKNKLYSAIKEFGIENFSLKIIEEITREKLNERERYWIKHYDSYYNGYNSTLGGQGEDSWFFDPELIQNFWDEGYSIPEIAYFVNCSVVTVGRRLKNYKDYTPQKSYARTVERRVYRNFEVFQCRSYTEEEAKTSQANNLVCQKKKVYQYDLKGNFLNEYSSLTEAGLNFSSNKDSGLRNIEDALSKSQPYAYGFLWSLEKVDKMLPYERKFTANTRMVRCIETREIFSSVTEAAHWCGLKNHRSMSAHLSGKRKSAGKHPVTKEKTHWEYV